MNVLHRLSSGLISCSVGRASTQLITRCSSKVAKVNLKDLIRLYDQFDRPIGIKPKSEAEELARKSRMDLVERTERPHSKYREFSLKSRIQELQQDAQSSEDAVTLKRAASQGELKRLTFTANISDYDFEYRYEQIVRILQKDVAIRLLVTGKPNGKQQLEQVYEKLKNKLTKGAKISQKVFSGHNMKVTLLPIAEELQQLIVSPLVESDAGIDKPEVELDSNEIDQLVQELLHNKHKPTGN
jgi:translation initiation factor IF-3